MRTALISDIHANATALEAVLKDIQKTGADQIICLGDITTLGPEPVACLHMIKALDCPCILGNHDAFMLDKDLIHTYTNAQRIIDLVDWARAQLSPADLDFLKGFTPVHDLSNTDGSQWLFFHGSPSNPMEDLLAFTPPENLDAMLVGRSAELIGSGHTHIQMMRQHRGILIVNPGSVGLPFREYVAGTKPALLAHAEYALVDKTGDRLSVALNRVDFDRKTFRKALTHCGGLVLNFHSRF